MPGFWDSCKRLLGRLFRRGRVSVETLAESLDRSAGIQRLSGQIRNLNRERKDLVFTIGKKVYSLHLRGKVRNRDVLSDCKRLDELKTQIEVLYAQIEEIRRRGVGELDEVLTDESLLGEDDDSIEEEPAEEPGEDEPADVEIELVDETAAPPAAEPNANN